MKILCVAATKFEIAPFIKNFPATDILISGVGIPFTIYKLTKKLQQKKYDLVIQAGIAGGFAGSLSLGEVVLIERDLFADIGITEKNTFSTIFETGFADKDEPPFTNGWLVNTNSFMKASALKKVRGITINTVTDNPWQTAIMTAKYDPQVETMEGAALHYTCLNEKIAFLQLRSISNFVGERNKSNWRIDEAITNLNITLSEIVTQQLFTPQA